MGNHHLPCNSVTLTATENKYAEDIESTMQEEFDTSSQMSTPNKVSKVATHPKILPPIKTFKDLMKESLYKNIEEQLYDRITKSLHTSHTKTNKTIQNILENQPDIQGHGNVNLDLLMLVEEEIDRMAMEKSIKGEQFSRQNVDRGHVFKRLNINLASFVRNSNENIKDYYRFEECLGEGSYGQVYRVVCRRSGEERAVKVLKRIKSGNQRQKSSLLAEFDLLSQLDHPNIVKLYQIYYFKGQYYVVMEYCSGGSLIKVIRHKKSFSEAEVAHIMKQLLSALAYLQTKNIVHRDIKLDNIVALNNSNKDGYYSIKIIDFGTAIKINRKKANIAGTRYYMAPQAIKGFINTKSDIWSSGIFLYLLFMGKFPFQAPSVRQMLQAIQSKDITFSGKQWVNISKEAKKLLLSLLEKKPQKRLSAKQALNHPWFHNTRHSSAVITYELSDLHMLQKYERGNNFVAIIQNYLSSRNIPQCQRDRLGSMFKQIDVNNDGVIEERQLGQICRDHFGSQATVQVHKILQEIDQNGSGRIDFNQFLVAMYSRKRLFLKSALEEAFNFYDMNKDGYLQRSELVQLLLGCENQQIEYLLKQLDTNGDERVSVEEFLDYLNQK